MIRLFKCYHLTDRGPTLSQCGLVTPYGDTDLKKQALHYNDVIMGAMASQITSLPIIYSTVYSDADRKKKHQSSVSLAFVRGIHRWTVNSPHKWPVTRKMFPFDNVIMNWSPYPFGKTPKPSMFDTFSTHFCQRIIYDECWWEAIARLPWFVIIRDLIWDPFH